MQLYVSLTGREKDLAIAWAKLLREECAAYKSDHPDDPGWSDEEAMEKRIAGAMGEMAAAKGLGVYWLGVASKYELDIVGYEVRTTDNLTGRLIIRPGNKEGCKYLHVVGRNGKYNIRGWVMYPQDMDPKWLGKSKPGDKRKDAYFVPNEALRSCSELEEIF